MESTLCLEMGIEREMSQKEFMSITLSNLEKVEGVLNSFEEATQASINTPTLEIKPITPLTPAEGVNIDPPVEPMAIESLATESSATSTPDGHTAPVQTGDGEMATSHQD